MQKRNFLFSVIGYWIASVIFWIASCNYYETPALLSTGFIMILGSTPAIIFGTVMMWFTFFIIKNNRSTEIKFSPGLKVLFGLMLIVQAISVLFNINSCEIEGGADGSFNYFQKLFVDLRCEALYKDITYLSYEVYLGVYGLYLMLLIISCYKLIRLNPIRED